MFAIPILLAGLAGWKYGVYGSETLLKIFGFSLGISLLGAMVEGGFGTPVLFLGLFAMRTALMVLAYRIGCKLSLRKPESEDYE